MSIFDTMVHNPSKGEITKLMLMASAMLAALLGLVAAQTVAPPAFEAASIKPDDAGGNYIEVKPGYLNAHSATPATCIIAILERRLRGADVQGLNLPERLGHGLPCSEDAEVLAHDPPQIVPNLPGPFRSPAVHEARDPPFLGPQRLIRYRAWRNPAQ